jgi:hypothetical protein
MRFALFVKNPAAFAFDCGTYLCYHILDSGARPFTGICLCQISLSEFFVIADSDHFHFVSKKTSAGVAGKNDPQGG